MNVLPPQGMVDWVLDLARNPLSTMLLVIAFAIVMFGLAGLIRSRRAAWQTAAAPLRHRRMLDDLASRWQLILLGTTAFVLSLASGYTTWMGMINFTGETMLSGMITFGIQGVMLIVAWLIGESFARGMSRRLPDGRRAGRLDAVISIVLAVLVVSVVFYWVLYASGTFAFTRAGSTSDFNWSRFADVSAYFALGLIVLGVLAFNFARGGELSLPYVQSIRIIVKNAMLWVMFLACMATSVFFSFESRFSVIFPKEERVRAAQLRAQNQVAGMVAEIGSSIESRRAEEIGRMFQAKGWVEYDQHLTRLNQVSQGAQREIEAYFNTQIEDRNRAIKQQQERIVSAQSGSAGLLARKNSLTDELSRLKGDRPALASDFVEKKSELDSRAKGVDAKRVEAQAEERGAEGTLKQGRGPMYRQIMADLARLQDAYKIQEARVRDSQNRLSSTDQRIAQLERELAGVDGALAKLRGEAETAEQRIKLTQASTPDDGQPRIDPSRIQPAFERVRLEFRQEPTRERLTALHQQCSQLYGAMASTPATQGMVRDIDCDPKQATEAAAVMFGLNDGLVTFRRTCEGGDKIAVHETTDALYGFARKCLADSGLPARETDALRTRINFLELSRDDKAHPFVATVNAFGDGNRLAYLSLAIAIAIDSLVLMAGLFGANAVRSPLSDVPSMKARSGKDLEKLIETSLGEEHERYDHARILFKRLRPSSNPNYSMEVALSDLGPTEVEIVLPVLSAGSEIGAVTPHPERGDVYLVRGELFAFVAKIANRKVVHYSDEAREHELKRILLSAMQPHVGDHVDIVLQHCHPISEQHGFSAEVFIGELSADDAFVVRKVLNAGSALNFVQLANKSDRGPHYFVHKQLFKTLLLISSAAHRSGQRSMAPRLAAPGQPAELEGGRLDEKQPSLAVEEPPRALTREAVAAPDIPEGQTDLEIEGEFWARLVSAIGVDPRIASERLSVQGLEQAAIGAWNALRIHAQSNPRLMRFLERHQREQEFKLKAAYNEIREGNRGLQRQNRILDGADELVERYLPALMVFPEHGLIDQIIAELELAAQSDDGLRPDEQTLVNRLKSLKQEIAVLDPAEVGDWDQIRQWYADAFSLDKPNVLRLAERRPRG